MNVGDQVAVIRGDFLGDGVALLVAKVDAVMPDGFTVEVSDGIAMNRVHCLASAEGTIWCPDAPAAVEALKSAYALR